MALLEIVGVSKHFGTTAVVVDRFMPATVAYVGDTEYLSLAYLRNFRTEVMAKTADGEKRMLICEWGLRVKSERSWATIDALT